MVHNAYVVIHTPKLEYYSFAGDFIANSGASIHLVTTTCELTLLNLIDTAKSNVKVKVNTKRSVQVMAHNNHDQKVYIDIPNVSYCPDLAANLLSNKQIINSDANVSFKDNTIW
ncbi:hypothetical protein MJO28_012435 [Puccinia striiformis f. sp. tritici]|uniref:Uncharacterized protein n=1 Tax=Puccinia striiformis f. sp. tritici TaxID=168172 RepID=A0ACC0E2X0_9BASI|nr:hypothetical protein MJO28_012435 [Puccinia striiformis f. sp. tritici]KAI7945595.1 hypothetical protein MJO29_011983 [Puccinia striiformis f. sp. tritici]